jgi:phosphate transport system permease protein
MDTHPLQRAPSPDRWGQLRRRRIRWGEWLAEKGILLVAFSAVLSVFLIFVFVVREALPLATGRVSTAASSEVIAPDQLDRVPAERVRAALGLGEAEFQRLSPEQKALLLQVRTEAASERAENPDRTLNTVSWRHLLWPTRWFGRDQAACIWQPVSEVPKFNLVPLIVGSLKVTAIAMLFAVPVSLAAALWVSQLAPVPAREVIKPLIEMLAGVPSVVLGSLAVLLFAPYFQAWFGHRFMMNATVAGLALGLSCVPLIFSLAEEALTSVPRPLLLASLALGASRWQTAAHVALPAALPGIAAAVVLGLGRAIGETMIVLITSGNAAVISWNPFDSVRTITATIAAELGETQFGGPHYRVLFLLGSLLFLLTWALNAAADWIMTRLRRRLEGRV